MENIKALKGSRVYTYNTRVYKERYILLGIDNCENIDSADIGAEAILTIDEAKQLIKALQERIDNKNLDL